MAGVLGWTFTCLNIKRFILVYVVGQRNISLLMSGEREEEENC